MDKVEQVKTLQYSSILLICFWRLTRQNSSICSDVVDHKLVLKKLIDVKRNSCIYFIWFMWCRRHLCL